MFVGQCVPLRLIVFHLHVFHLCQCLSALLFLSMLLLSVKADAVLAAVAAAHPCCCDCLHIYFMCGFWLMGTAILLVPPITPASRHIFGAPKAFSNTALFVILGLTKQMLMPSTSTVAVVVVVVVVVAVVVVVVVVVVVAAVAATAVAAATITTIATITTNLLLLLLLLLSLLLLC